jgi:gas vesicle protein
MKLSDITDLNKEDILAAIGLASKPTTAEKLLGTLSIFGVGLLVGAGTALLLAPKSGQDLRGDLGERLRKLREEKFRSGDDDTDGSDGSSVSSSSRDEARP